MFSATMDVQMNITVYMYALDPWPRLIQYGWIVTIAFWKFELEVFFFWE